MIADIAFIFHWGLDSIVQMRVGEIIQWRDRALGRWNQVHETNKE
ncbi:MAG: GpE family phage tail protein [Pseudomonadales bacterium]|nr:GpE family phage tail protein [Pseudomonadales bacterium]